jgi:hypothetical protein
LKDIKRDIVERYRMDERPATRHELYDSIAAVVFVLDAALQERDELKKRVRKLEEMLEVEGE